jgi:3-(3-hydroxy-phenyl)propionate hydroxylase
VQDAFNLGWKLASVVKQRCEPALLDTYHAERHPVAAAVLRDTLAQVALLRTDRRTDALREVTGKLLGMEGPRQEIAGRLSGLTTRYAPDEEDASPLVGARIPDLEVTRGEDTVQLYSLMHGAKPLFLTSGDAPADLEGWADRVTIEQVTFPETWRIPVTGEVASPRAVLVRPDGYIAWIDDGSGGTDIKHCFKFWFGEPASA